MAHRAANFIHAVAGTLGSNAIAAATQAKPAILPVLVPRCALAWIKNTNFYEGPIPGNADTHLFLAKTETGYFCRIHSPGIALESDNKPAAGVAAMVAVALGSDTQSGKRLNGSLNSRLSKSLDLLIKSQIEDCATDESGEIQKAIGAIKPSSQTGDGVHDYSHALPEHLRNSGHKLSIERQTNVFTGTHDLFATVTDPAGRPMGVLSSTHNPKTQELKVDLANVKEDHRGKGVGKALYEASMAHGFHTGARTISGDEHSSDAKRVHEKLAAKHGFEYVPEPHFGPGTKYETASAWASSPSGALDKKWAPYKYTMKMEKADAPGGPNPGQAPKPPAPPKPAMPAIRGSQPPKPPKPEEPPKPKGAVPTFKQQAPKMTGIK